MKKLLVTLFSLAMILGSTPQAFAEVKTEPSDAAINFAQEMNVTGCFKDTKRKSVRLKTQNVEDFQWKTPVVLEEAICAILHSTGLLKSEIVDGGKKTRLPFGVRSVNDVYKPYLKFASLHELLPENAKPGDILTRAQTLDVLFKVNGIPVPRIIDDRDRTYLFGDVRRDSRDESLALTGVNRDIISPVDATNSGIFDQQTRGELVEMLLRSALGREAEAFFQNLPSGGQDNLLELFVEPASNIPNIDLLYSVWDIVTNNHIDAGEFDQTQAVYDAINGMIKGLNDPYTQFLAPEETDSLHDQLDNTVEGIGAFISKEGDDLTIISPIKTSPAEAAGLQGGDIVTAIDGTDAAPLTISEAVKLIKGKPGTSVTLTIKRDDLELFDITIVRARVDVPTVEYKWIQGNIAYVNLYNFGEQTVEKFDEFVQETRSRRPSGIILDLRNNPGGLLNVAEALAGYFIEEGKATVNVEYDNIRFEDVSYGTGELRQFPLVVLINKGSASASEILAGAIQDHKLGKIIGETSFGKGTVQEIVPFLDGSSLRITVARWLTPEGHSINKNGITPDIVAVDDKATPEDEVYDRAVKELQF